VGSLQERLDAYKKDFESGKAERSAPPEAIEKMHRATAELRATGIEGRSLRVGERMPAFTLFNQDHVEVASSDLLRNGALIISFFRGHW
jgi:hypothetical protein